MTYIPEGKYLSLREAATQKGVKKITVQKWVEKGLEAIMVDGFTLINVVNLEAFKPKRAGRPKQK